MAEGIIPQNECVVYWLFDDNCVCPWRHGYVGISERWERRLKEHRKDKRFPVGFSWQILFRGTRNECLDWETKLRADYRVGWNIWKGGRAGMAGVPKSAEHNEKNRQAALRRFSNPKELERLSIAVKKGRQKGFQQIGPNNPRFGIVMDENTKRNISVGRKGKAIGNQNWRKRGPYSIEALRKMREAGKRPRSPDAFLRGEKHPMFGKKQSDEWRQKNRAAQLRIDWRGERNGFYGKKHSEETRRILSVKAKERQERIRQLTEGE